jgi:hypothetical protein
MNKIFFKEDGQSVVLIAVSILLIVFVGLSVFSLGEALNNKSQFRNISDAVSFAGTCTQQKGCFISQSLLDIDSLVKISYNFGVAFDNLSDGAKILIKESPSYDPTANIINSSEIHSLISPYNGVIHPLINNPKYIKPANSVYNASLSFSGRDSIIFARKILEKNLELLPSEELKNLSCVSLPSEIFLLRGPIQNVSGDTSRFKFELSINDGKIASRYYRVINGNTEIGGAGIFNIMVADTPKLLFQQVLPDNQSGKLGKFLSFSYSSPFSEEGEGSSFSEAIKISSGQLENINATNADIVKAMKKSKDKHTIEGYWDNMVSNYNGFLSYLNSNNLKAAFDLNLSSYRLEPVFSSLKDMKLLNLKTYKDLALEKGYNINNEEDIQDFYKTLTLRDIFGTEDNFRTAVEETINSFATNQSNVKSDLTTLLNEISVFNKDSSSGKNIPYVLINFANIINENLEESTLGPFLEVLTLVGNGINLTYTNINEFHTTSSFSSDYDFNSLKPNEDFYNLLDHFFDTPLIKLEGT